MLALSFLMFSLSPLAAAANDTTGRRSAAQLIINRQYEKKGYGDQGVARCMVAVRAGHGPRAHTRRCTRLKQDTRHVGLLACQW